MVALLAQSDLDLCLSEALWNLLCCHFCNSFCHVENILSEIHNISSSELQVRGFPIQLAKGNDML